MDGWLKDSWEILFGVDVVWSGWFSFEDAVDQRPTTLSPMLPPVISLPWQRNRWMNRWKLFDCCIGGCRFQLRFRSKRSRWQMHRDNRHNRMITDFLSVFIVVDQSLDRIVFVCSKIKLDWVIFIFEFVEFFFYLVEFFVMMLVIFSQFGAEFWSFSKLILVNFGLNFDHFQNYFWAKFFNLGLKFGHFQYWFWSILALFIVLFFFADIGQFLFQFQSIVV